MWKPSGETEARGLEKEFGVQGAGLNCRGRSHTWWGLRDAHRGCRGRDGKGAWLRRGGVATFPDWLLGRGQAGGAG